MNDEKNNIKFSIIMPVYNVSDFLEEAILSVLNQKYQNIQLIIVNDGSTDDSQIIAEKFLKQDKRVILVNKKNEGVSVARNIGLNLATGDYLFFMDSDDVLREDLFMNVHQHLCKSMGSVLMIGYERFNGTKTFRGKTIDPNRYTNFQIVHAILDGQLENYVWQFIIKKTVLSDDLKFKTGILFIEDFDWTVRFLAHVTSVEYINEPLYRYRIRENSVTHTRSKKKAHDIVSILEIVAETIASTFPNESKNFNTWRKPLDITVYYDYTLLGWESIATRDQMFRKIKTFDNKGLSIKQQLKLILIKMKLVDMLGYLVKKSV